MSLFDEPKWPIWKVLAWVLTRDRESTERAGPQDFALGADEEFALGPDEEYVSRDEVAQAWRDLRGALVAGSIKLFPIAHIGDANQASPPTDNTRQISPNVVHSQTWDWLAANVEASSQDVLQQFQPGSKPIAERVDLTQPEIRPDGPGYMDLTDAACWIATEGGKVGFFYRDKERWRPAFEKLLPAVASGEIEVIGRHSGDLAAQIIGAHFASITVEYPYEGEVHLNLMFGEKPHVKCWGGWDDERERYIDELWVGDRKLYSHLQVRKEHVFKLWPFKSDEAQYKSGGPGRPTSINLVMQEFRSRLDRGVTASSITVESEALAKWLKEHHPDAPQLKPKTIRNHIASEYRQARARN
jgi:hypothetical protein